MTTRRSDMVISLNEQIAEVRRELEQRARVYPRMVSAGKMRQAIADYQTERMKAVLHTLEALKVTGATARLRVEDQA